MKTVFTEWMLMILLKICIYPVVSLAENIRHFFFRLPLKPRFFSRISATLVALVFLISCNVQPSGVSKNLGTGLVITYKGITVEESGITMNGEVLNHADIPIGESFIIRNEKVKGLTVKNGKVSVGCSLQIQDKDGKILLSEPDLFKGQDIFEKDKIDYFTCTVNTGEPMKWEEKYLVTVVFTDKFGKGQIENKVTIRMIDIP